MIDVRDPVSISAPNRVGPAERARSDRVDCAQIECGRLGVLCKMVSSYFNKPRGVHAAGATQDLQQIKTSGFRDPPGSHELASYLIDRVKLAFEHRDRRPWRASTVASAPPPIPPPTITISGPSIIVALPIRIG
jgi:hypothetical protein